MISHKLLLDKLRYTNGELLWLTGPRKGKRAGCLRPDNYRVIGINGLQYLEHRVIWFYHHKRWPNKDLDHKDRDRSNNKITNLREAAVSDNNINSGVAKHNTSGYRGVYFCRGMKKWAAQIDKNNKAVYLGCYNTKEEAAFARQTAEAQMFPEYAVKRI